MASFYEAIKASSQIQDMLNCKGEAGRNQEVSEVNFFLQLFSISIATSDGGYVLAPSNSEKGCLFQHIISRERTTEGVSTD